jgi:hypothetical protein
MRRLLLFLALAGCSDLGSGNGLSTGPQPVPSEPGDRESGAIARWAALSAEEKQAAVRIIDRIATEQRVTPLRGQLALVEGNLPGGALVVVVQNLQAPERPIFVLSEKTATDDAMILGITAFTRGIGPEGEALSGQVLSVTLPEAVRSDATVHASRRLGSPQVPPGRRRLLDQLTLHATSVTTIDLPGIGRGVLFRFD